MTSRGRVRDVSIRPGTTPGWALDLIEQVCRDHNRKPAQIRCWRNSRVAIGTRGTTWHRDQTISITAGNDRDIARAVLLHELAHYLVGTKANHTKRFWLKCWDLHRRYGDLEVAWRQESWYKQKAVTYAPVFECRGCEQLFPTPVPVTRQDKPFHSESCRDRYIEQTGDGPEGLKDLLRLG